MGGMLRQSLIHLNKAIKQLYMIRTKFYFTNTRGERLDDLCMIIATLPCPTSGVGVIKIFDKELPEGEATTDLLYRVNPDGSMHIWKFLENEDDSKMSLSPHFNAKGDIIAISITLAEWYVAHYERKTVVESYYPSEEYETN